MKLSRYNRLVSVGDHSILFNCLTGAMAVIEDYVAKSLATGGLADIPPGLAADMASGGFVVADDTDEVQAFRHIWYRAQHDDSLAGVSISPTLKCNMRCGYCLAHRDNAVMTGRTADGVVNLLRTRTATARRLAVTWFGGEPLLALDIVEYISRQASVIADRAGMPYYASMFTNAYELDDRTVSLLAGLGIESVIVAVDGPREVHELRRPHAGGQPCFDRIINNVLAASQRLSITLQCVVDAGNKESAWQLFDELSARGALGDNIRFRIGRMDCDAVAGRVAGDHQLHPADFERCHIDGLRARMNHSALAIQYPVLNSGCSYQRFSSLCVDPDGDLYKCIKATGAKEWSVGNLESVPSLTSAAMAPWLGLDPCLRDQCRDCAVLPLCSGGCSLVLLKTGRSRCHPFSWALDEWLRLNLEWRAVS